MSNEEANELWDEIGKRATVRSRVAAKVVREGKNIRLLWYHQTLEALCLRLIYSVMRTEMNLL